MQNSPATLACGHGPALQGRRPAQSGAAPIGPSGIDVNTLEQTAEPMSIAKIEEVINAFARAAADAKRLGLTVWNCMERTAT
ncbi:MAG: hypothetical protein ACLT38_03955 [Akkermansia sp.]